MGYSAQAEDTAAAARVVVGVKPGGDVAIVGTGLTEKSGTTYRKASYSESWTGTGMRRDTRPWKYCESEHRGFVQSNYVKIDTDIYTSINIEPGRTWIDRNQLRIGTGRLVIYRRQLI